MSCCGKSRVQPISAPRLSMTSRGSVTFQYTGKTRLTVIGPITRQRYDFDHGGARVVVDSRDSHALSAVPTLKRV